MNYFVLFETIYGSISECLGVKNSLVDSIRLLMTQKCSLIQCWNDEKLILSIDSQDLSEQGIYLYGEYFIHKFHQNGELKNVQKLSYYDQSCCDNFCTMYVFSDNIHLQTVYFANDNVTVKWEI